MRDLDTDGKYTIRYQAVAMARDVLTISAVTSLLATGFWFAIKPYAQPFLDLPQQVAQLTSIVAPITNPRLVEFDGYGIILDNGSGYPSVEPGDRIRIMYHVRRNVDCDTTIDLIFMNVNTGIKIQYGSIPAIRSNVTNDFSPFIFSLEVPEDIPPGSYVYAPRFNPILCGVYKPYNFAISQPFKVTTSGE